MPGPYVFHAVVSRCGKRTELKEVHKLPSGELIRTDLDLGWFLTIQLGGIELSFGLGSDEPGFAKGDRLKLTLESVEKTKGERG